MAAAFAPKRSQVLMTPKPHYIPGYTGYCPHYKFSMGKTYGQQTSQLLTSPEVLRSCQLVLQPTRWSCRGTEPQNLPGKPGACCGAGTQSLSSIIIPGYTGFIPRAQCFFAKTYSEICKEARSDFAKQRLRAAGKEQAWLKTRTLLQDPTQESNVRRAGDLTADPLGPGCHQGHPAAAAALAASAPYALLHTFQPQCSPYSMEDDDPQKYFISGFTGFVPRARFLIGTGYPITTNRALVEFSQMALKKGDRSETKEGSTILPPLGKTYPRETGLPPHYTGYVPGYKFQFGHTYGHLTNNALSVSTVKKQMPD
ncbi:ciliary microtubule inner protein 2B-like [Struthio camelus]|uniref:ciliary microtubule inner protein 2B-like n=1 Tax=Struthio camelus TaxID=8801 RepID=UPI0036041A6C